MRNSHFTTTVYIRATRPQIWQALTLPEHTKLYWCETHQICDWQVGSSWTSMIPDGRVGDSGEVLAIDLHKRLVLAWRNAFIPEMMAEGYSRLCIELEDMGSCTKLSLSHEMAIEDSKLIQAVSQGWPMILSSLKSYLETGQPLLESRYWPKDL